MNCFAWMLLRMFSVSSRGLAGLVAGGLTCSLRVLLAAPPGPAGGHGLLGLPTHAEPFSHPRAALKGFVPNVKISRGSVEGRSCENWKQTAGWHLDSSLGG